MIKNYFLVTLRNLKRNKSFSLINIAGLAIGLSACMLLWQYVRFESSYDQFHRHADRLYRVSSNTFRGTSIVGGNAPIAPAVAPAMKADFPEVIDFCRLVKTSLFTGDLTSFFANSLEFSYEHHTEGLIAFNEEHVWFSDASFFKMFSFPLKAGNSIDALKTPNSVVITESIAQKYFGNEPALGKEIRLNREMVLKITGVLQDIPQNSHLQFDILISFSTMKQRIGDGYQLWDWPVFYSYLLLAPGTNVSTLDAKVPAFMKKYRGQNNEGEYHQRFFLQPIKDIHLRSQLGEEQSVNGNERTVYFLSILAAFILVVAWINYINLSTAKAMERSKEVGLRKTVGASRSQLVVQFLFDAAIINVLAFLFAAFIVILAWPWFESLVGKQMSEVLLQNRFMGGASQGLFIVLLFLFGVVFVGSYPALLLSSFNPAQVLKGKFFKSPTGLKLRKLMISFQYVLAVLLVAGSVTIYLQLSFMQSQDPGFAKDQMLVLEAPAVYDSLAGSKINYFKNTILQIPEVTNVTASNDVPGRMMVEGSSVYQKSSDVSKNFFANIPSIDTSFLSTYKIRLLEGRMFNEHEMMNFRRRGNQESIPVMVNEEFVKQMDLKDHKDALNEKLIFWWGPEERQAEIIGITANHHQVYFKERVLPVMYVQPQWVGWKYFSVHIKKNSSMQQTISSVEAAYLKAFPDNPFSYFFLDEFFDRQYNQDRQFGKIFTVFTFLAIFVTCLGLLGLSIFSVTQRTKEMGIRKVLGASASLILVLFSKDFLKILFISYLITLPVIYWAGEQWLQNFSFRIPLGWQIFVLPLVLLIIITLATIGVISFRSLFETPVKALRQE